jgi:hypothetical protein
LEKSIPARSGVQWNARFSASTNSDGKRLQLVNAFGMKISEYGVRVNPYKYGEGLHPYKYGEGLHPYKYGEGLHPYKYGGGLHPYKYGVGRRNS